MPKQKNRVALYARFSSNNQREESIDAQIRAMKEYCQKNGLQIVAIYADEAKSATSDNRPQFLQMISDSDKKIFDIVLIHKLDRFSRNRYDSAIYKNKLKKNGVEIRSVLERLDNSPESIILESLLTAMSEYYSHNLSREVRKGQKENALVCKQNGGKPPLGYDVGNDLRLIINEEEAEIVRLIFDLYYRGYGYTFILKELENRGYRSKIGGHFTKHSLRAILTNEKYKGTYIFNKQKPKRGSISYGQEIEIIRIPDGCPAIVSAEVFDTVQKRMQLNNYNNGGYSAKEVYLLRRVIRCGECGKAMTGNTRYSGRNKSRYSTYRCITKRHLCENKEINREYLECYVIMLLEQHIFNEQAMKKLIKNVQKQLHTKQKRTEKELQTLTQQQAELTTAIQRVAEIIEATEGSDLLLEKITTMEEKRSEIKQRILWTTEQLEKQQQPLDGKNLLATYRKVKAIGNAQEYREFITQFIQEIVVYRYHVIIRLKTGLGVLDEMDSDFEVKRKDLYECNGGRIRAV